MKLCNSNQNYHLLHLYKTVKKIEDITIKNNFNSEPNSPETTVKLTALLAGHILHCTLLTSAKSLMDQLADTVQLCLQLSRRLRESGTAPNMERLPRQS